MKVIYSKEQFQAGVSFNPETGFEDLRGTDLFRENGFVASGWTSVAMTSSVAKAPTFMIPDTEISDTASFMWLISASSTLGTGYKYKVDDDTIAATVSLGANQGYGGAAKLGNWIYTAGNFNTTNLGRINLTAVSNSATWQSFQNTSDYHELLPFKDVIYGCDGNKIITISDSSTYETNSVAVESGYNNVALAPFGEYLAIGSIKGSYNPSQATPAGYYKSKLYFWDTISSSYDEERSTTIDGRILKLVNKKGVLYAIVKDRADSIMINYFDGQAIQPLKRVTIKSGTTMVEPQLDAFDLRGDQIYMGGHYSGSVEGKVLTYGRGNEEAPVGVLNPYTFYAPGSIALSKIYSVKWATPDVLFTSAIDASSTQVTKIFKEANGTFAFAILTPNISAGTTQMLSRLKLNFKPLVSGDAITIHHKVNYASSWTSWKSISFTNEGAVSTYSITDGLEFDNLQFQITQGAGDAVKIKNIIIESEDIDKI